MAAQALGIALSDTPKITFFVPMPKSWSKKKKDAHRLTPHQQVPDLSNYLKAIEDACLQDDSGIWHADVSKRWADEGSIEVEEIGE